MFWGLVKIDIQFDVMQTSPQSYFSRKNCGFF